MMSVSSSQSWCKMSNIILEDVHTFIAFGRRLILGIQRDCRRFRDGKYYYGERSKLRPFKGEAAQPHFGLKYRIISILHLCSR